MPKNIKHKMVILGAFISGISVSLYIKSFDSSATYITLEEKKGIESKIDTLKQEIINLNKIKSQYEDKLQKYKVAKKDEDSINNIMTNEIKNLKILSGESDITGEGVVVTINDSKRELKEGENPNDLLVHDIDILRIINDLKRADAKAISINGERLIPLSEIKCSGSTITVNKKTYGQPFIITAIGNKDMLLASIASPESYASLLKEGYEIDIQVNQKSSITIKSYKKYK